MITLLLFPIIGAVALVPIAACLFPVWLVGMWLRGEGWI